MQITPSKEVKQVSDPDPEGNIYIYIPLLLSAYVTVCGCTCLYTMTSGSESHTCLTFLLSVLCCGTPNSQDNLPLNKITHKLSFNC